MDEGEPVHGDVGTVAVLADIHAVSGREMEWGGGVRWERESCKLGVIVYKRTCPPQDLQGKLAAHGGDFDATKTCAQDLIANCLDDPTETEADLSRLQEQWNMVNEQAAAKQARLDEAAEVCAHTHTHTHTHTTHTPHTTCTYT